MKGKTKFKFAIVALVSIIITMILSATSSKVYAASYNGNYVYWSQGSSDYYMVRTYGCWVVAQAKLLYETGVDRRGVDQFNPDTYAEWEVNNGLLPNLTNNLNQIDGGGAPVVYAKQVGKNLEYLGTCNPDAFWGHINAGNHIIVKVNGGAHYVYVDNAMSKSTGQIYIQDSSTDNYYTGPRPLSAYGVWNCGYVYRTDGSNFVQPITPITSLGDFTARIVPKDNTSIAIGIEGSTEISNVLLETKDKSDLSQLWRFTKNSDNSYLIRNVETQKVLDVANAQNANGVNVQTHTTNGHSAQNWYITEYNGGYRIVSQCTNNTKSLDIYGSKIYAGTNIIIWEQWSRDNGAQTFKFENVIPVESIELDKTEVTIKQGESIQLNAKISPSNADIKTLDWTVFNENIVTIDSTGKVTGKAPGKSAVYASAKDGLSSAIAVCLVTVKADEQIDIRPYIDNSGVIFDAEYYLNKYPDLKKAYGTDATKAYNHFVTKGIKEGRQGSRVFNVKYYLEKNADVKKAYGNNYSKALRHFATKGMKERRIASSEFNVKLYIANYTDLQKAYGMNYKKYYAHFETKGYKEKRIATKLISKKLTDIDKCVFDAKYYLAKYPDVKKAYGNDYTKAYNHFITNGLNEGRQGSMYFNVKYYLAKYPDLQKAYGNDYIKAYNHFKTNGLKEGRIGSAEFNVKVYQANYADLRKAFGNNYLKYYLHYMNNGIKENRKAV